MGGFVLRLDCMNRVLMREYGLGFGGIQKSEDRQGVIDYRRK
jgi:hypothetical protein